MTRTLPVLLTYAALTLGACSSDIIDPGTPPPPPTLDAQFRATLRGWGIVPIGPMPALDPTLVALGQALFFDKILSGNRDVACATCHQIGTSLGDGRSLAIGTGAVGQGSVRTLGPGRQFTSRGAPTLLNVGLGLPLLFWDGRLAGPQFFGPPGPSPIGPPTQNLLEAQAFIPVVNRLEMLGESGDLDVLGNSNELALHTDPQAVVDGIMARLLAIQEYVDLFRAAFPTVVEPRFDEAARAIATFERSAFTKTRSAFDRYLDLDDLALSTAQKRGGLLFFGRALCSSCHNGPFLGGQGFANVGAPQIGPGGTRDAPRDLGVGERDDNEFYRFAFRVAPLRNVELTGPYFHSGAYRTLEEVVEHYNDVPTALRTFDPSGLSADVRPLYHGDQGTIDAVLQSLDFRLRQPLDLSDQEMADLVAFLKALTDPAARNLSSLVPVRVPSGLPVSP